MALRFRSGRRGGREPSPLVSRVVQIAALVLFGPLALAALVWAHLVVGSAVVSAGVVGWQHATGSTVDGTLTRTQTSVLRSRGTTARVCMAWLDSDDGRHRQHPVRVYADDAACDDLRGSRARLVPGVANALNHRLSSSQSPLSAKLRLGTTFGVLDGASVGDTAAFVKSLWPFLVFVPMVVLPDGALLMLLRDRRRRRRATRSGSTTPETPTV